YSVTKSSSSVESAYTQFIDDITSLTRSSSSVSTNTLETISAQSKTVSKSRVDTRLRSFRNEPQRYQQSSQIFIYDKDERLQLVLSDNTIPYINGWYTEQLNGEQVLEFDVIANNPDVEMIDNDGRAVIRDIDGEFVEFIIRVAEDIDDSSGTIKRVQAEGGEYELIDEWITGYKASNVTLHTALNAILGGTRWQTGNIDNLGTQSVDLRNMSVKEAIYELLNIFDGERRTRVEVDGKLITRRYIDIYRNRGDNTGKRFEVSKDILSTQRTLDSSGIKTALYGFGASGENDKPRLTF